MIKADQASSSAIGSASHDLAGLHLDEQAEDAAESEKYKEKPVLSMKQEELVAKVRKEEEESDRKNISLIVVGMLLTTSRIMAHELTDLQVTLMLGNRL